MSTQQPSCVLTFSCPDTVGIVAAVTGFLGGNDYFIEESSQFGDQGTGTFFSRIQFSQSEGEWSEEKFRETFAPVGEQFSMDWDVHNTAQLPRVVIMVSKYEHCLNDLLYRYRTGALRMEIPAIISNHDDLRNLAEWHDIPFHHVPVTTETKADAEQQLLQIMADTQADLVVLARYMQVLSDDLCRKLWGRAINIHHSFLPGFKGARPYQQAHDRGVKLIGATAHYVSPDLDEGPIIEQAVERADHTHGVDGLTAVGRDTESITLARAVQYHIEHRVFLNGSRTVVFR
jgi:formyltetrahydrofolate deformylase